MAMQSAVAAARAILTSLHEVMASRAGAQAKLNQVVEVIGESLNSEVCSIYLLREGMLELFATRGLNQSAVHVTRLAVGEGLVGTIAERSETLNLAEAASHPDFAFRPETGEESSIPSPACRSCGANGRWGCWVSSTSTRAGTRKSRSRPCRPWPWCCRN
jgi:phosphotransferase system enzyme I (PtsP)